MRNSTACTRSRTIATISALPSVTIASAQKATAVVVSFMPPQTPTRSVYEPTSGRRASCTSAPASRTGCPGSRQRRHADVVDQTHAARRLVEARGDDAEEQADEEHG